MGAERHSAPSHARCKGGFVEDKKITDGELEAGDTKPLSVFSILWRGYLAAWLQDKGVKQWQARTIPPRGPVVGGTRSQDALEAAAAVADAWAEHGYAGILDYAQCYDRQSMNVATKSMNKLAFPAGLVAVLQSAWCAQKRCNARQWAYGTGTVACGVRVAGRPDGANDLKLLDVGRSSSG